MTSCTTVNHSNWSKLKCKRKKSTVQYFHKFEAQILQFGLDKGRQPRNGCQITSCTQKSEHQLQAILGFVNQKVNIVIITASFAQLL